MLSCWQSSRLTDFSYSDLHNLNPLRVFCPSNIPGTNVGMDECWRELPCEVFERHVLPRLSIDLRRAFGVFGRLSHRQLSLDHRVKAIQSGYMRDEDSFIKWVVGERTYRHCRVYRAGRDTLWETLTVTSEREGNVYSILWDNPQLNHTTP